MDPGLLLRGAVIGFAVAAALGPVGLLVIRRTIDRGFRHGLASGVGVATADGLYGAVAAFGLTAVTQLLVGLDRLLGVVGGIVLIVMAARAMWAMRSTPATTIVARTEPGGFDRPLGAWASMVALTLMNPATILSFAALFAGIGAGTGGPAGAAVVTCGVFAGSLLWWVILTAITAGLRARMTARAVHRLNIASALVIGAFGVVALVMGVNAG